MRKTKLTVGVLVVAGCLSVFAASKKDPVLMTVNGEPVTLSEFEYMYHKNNQQQVAKMPLEKYVDMFTVYKLKVADAKAEGIDTTASFQREFNGYRNELLFPFLLDTVAEENLAKEQYERMKWNVKASHIMMKLGNNIADGNKIKARLDSIRNCILAGQSFEELALKYSIDPSVKRNKGSMGYISVGRFPWQFEDACYTTPVGEVSQVFATDYGYHIVKVYDRRPDEGKVLAEHILKLYPRNATQTQKDSVAALADSIYKVVKNGADFEDVAKRESQDPGSARKGGQLPWFGRGEMVPEFESVAFELPKDSISEPFATVYGVHIVKKLDSKKVGTYDEMRQQVMNMLKSGPKGNVAYQSRVEQLKKKYRFMINTELVNRLKSEVTSPNQLDSAFIAKYENSTEKLFSVNDVNYPLSLLIKEVRNLGRMKDDLAYVTIDSKINQLGTTRVVECEKDSVEANDADIHNLINEYRDGMLLFEVSNRKVWNKGATDLEGLEAYFEANRDKYRWTEPKFKGYLVQTTGDSITKLVKARLGSIGTDSLTRVLRRDYGKFLKIEKLLVSKGENAMVDSYVFGGAKVAPDNKKYTDYFVCDYKVIAQPEEVADVRGTVVSDYQNELEKQWVEQLKQQYPVKIDKKVYKKIE